MKIWNRLRLWAGRHRAERELSDEMRAHREMLEERYVGEGMSREEAHFAALRQFGGRLANLEQSRDEWGFGSTLRSAISGSPHASSAAGRC
jgi:hypothetical protein